MTKVERIQAEIESLEPNEYAQLRNWFTERDWHRWDAQIEADSQAEKLDALSEEALREKKSGELKEL